MIRFLVAMIALALWSTGVHAQDAADPRVAAAAQTRDAYWRAIDAENYAGAYAMLTSGMQAMLSADQSARLEAGTTSAMGHAIERRVMRTTVYDNPPGAPAPGVYVAFDYVGRFERADRNCGYIILHQPADGEPFRVTRTEQTFLPNATAAASDQPDVDWAQLATSMCPGWQPSWTIQPPV